MQRRLDRPGGDATYDLGFGGRAFGRCRKAASHAEQDGAIDRIDEGRSRRERRDCDDQPARDDVAYVPAIHTITPICYADRYYDYSTCVYVATGDCEYVRGRMALDGSKKKFSGTEIWENSPVFQR